MALELELELIQTYKPGCNRSQCCEQKCTRVRACVARKSKSQKRMVLCTASSTKHQIQSRNSPLSPRDPETPKPTPTCPPRASGGGGGLAIRVLYTRLEFTNLPLAGASGFCFCAYWPAQYKVSNSDQQFAHRFLLRF